MRFASWTQRRNRLVPNGWMSLDVDGISRMTISKLVRGKQRITAELALRLARFFGTTPQFWLNLQQAWDLEEAKAALKDELGKIQPLRPSEKENSAISGA